MKILKITSSGFREGGVENLIAQLVPILNQRGHNVKVLASNTRPDKPHFNDYSYKKPPGGLGKVFYSFNFNSYKTLKKILVDFQPDVVHIHTVGHASPSILFALKNYPTVLTIHGPEGYTKNLILYCLPATDFNYGEYDINSLRLTGKLRYFYYRYINYYIYRLGLRNIDTFITHSHYMNSLMNQEGLKSEYIPNGISLFDYKPLRKDAINNIIMYAGRLEKYKGVDYLISAMPEIILRFPDMKLYIAGEGFCKNEFEALSAKLKLENNIFFLGQLDRRQIQKFYETASAVVVPSTWPEAFGLIGIEALSVGRPVVATDVGGISDWLVDGQNGFLVPPKDSGALARAIIKLFSNQDVFLDMMENGRKKAEEFGLNKHAENLEKIYSRLIKSKTHVKNIQRF